MEYTLVVVAEDVKEVEVQQIEVVIQDQVVEEEEDIAPNNQLQDLALVALQTLVVVEVVLLLLEIQVVALTLVDLVL